MNHIDPILMDILSTEKRIPENPQINLTFNEILIKATFHNCYEVVKKLVESEEFDKSILEDIGLMNIPFPLYYITMCYKKVMWTGFREEVLPFVKEQQKSIDLLLDLWKNQFGVDTEATIDYKKYEDYFYCLSDDETIEEVFMDPIELFLENGCRKIDLDLFEAVDKFQFSKVKELLQKGANLNANLAPINDNQDDYFNCLDRIGGECSYLCTCQIFPLIKEPHGAWYINYPIGDQEIGDLVGWAAHEEMYNLLENNLNIIEDDQ